MSVYIWPIHPISIPHIVLFWLTASGNQYLAFIILTLILEPGRGVAGAVRQRETAVKG